jgi:hypothetical protein
MFKISAFLFAGLIFFVTFLHQGKKVKAIYSERKFQVYRAKFILQKKQEEIINHLTDYLLVLYQLILIKSFTK